ncbi:MAG: hypothetical protein RhofKO_32540 [Rhodothermales bacterium]
MTTPRTVLVIDDSDEDRQTFRRALLAHPSQRFKVYDALDVETGLAFMDARNALPIDVVLLDLHLPGLDGLAFLQTLSARDGFVHVPVIVLTGSATYTLNNALQAGAQDFIQKRLGHDEAYFRELYRAIDAAIERHKVVQKLHESQAHFREITTALDQVFWMYNVAEERIHYVSPAFERVFGEDPAPLYSGRLTLADFAHPNDRTRLDEGFRAWLEAGCTYEYHEQYRVPTKGGDLLWMQNRARAVLDSDTPFIGGLITDITQLKHNELTLKQQKAQLSDLNQALEARVAERTQQVYALSKALTEAERREREAIAQVLHDDLQQLLYSQQFRISLFRQSGQHHTPASTESLLVTLSDLVDRSIEMARTLVSQLKGINTSDLGEGLAWVTEHMRKHYDFELRVTIEDAVHLAPTLVNLLIHITRELVFNVVKHAGVKQATVHVTSTSEGTQLVVQDAGCGFNPKAMTRAVPVSFGLHSITERLGLVGGTFQVTSQPGQGTRAHVFLPHVITAAPATASELVA